MDASDGMGVGGGDPMIGRVIASRYRLEKKLGSGAMGTVYLARHVKLRRAFAVKVLRVDLLEDDKLQKRFVREAELSGTLSHPNVVRVTDVGETYEGLHYIAMEYAEGPTLGEIISEQAPLSAVRVIALVKQLLAGLHHAHEHGLIHRDFKPDNVIVVTENEQESPRILDFGIAIVRDDASSTERERLTTAGITLGTPHYMAPEHVTGQAIDHRIDLFALGVVLYEMLCGQMPFDGDGVDVARANLLEATPPMKLRAPLADVDPLLEAFTRMLLAKSPDARPASAKHASEILDAIARDRPRAAAMLGVPRDDEIAPGPPPQPTGSPATDLPRPSAPRTYTPPTPLLASSPSGQHAQVAPPLPASTNPIPTRVAPSPPRTARGSTAPLPAEGARPRARTATARHRRLWIMLAAAIAAVALGAVLAVLLA